MTWFTVSLKKKINWKKFLFDPILSKECHNNIESCGSNGFISKSIKFHICSLLFITLRNPVRSFVIVSLVYYLVASYWQSDGCCLDFVAGKNALPVLQSPHQN